MSLFGKGTRRHAAPGYSVIDEHLTIRGEIDTDGTIRVDGRVEGTSHRVGTMIVGATGTVHGSVQAREVFIAGSIEGDVTATGRVEIESGAAVHGQISASAMVLREGATIHGLVSIGGAPPESASVAPAKRLELAPVTAVRTRGQA